MNATLQKERRSLRPSFLATVAATVLSAIIFNGSDASGVVIAFYAVGAVLMSASIFGNEFHSRTMLLLLTQPVPRRQLWNDKMRELALELFVSFVVLILSLAFLVHEGGRIGSHPDLFLLEIGVLCAIPLIAFSSAPFLSLLVKNVLGAMAFTFVLPYVLVLCVMLIDWALSSLVGHEDLFLHLFDENHPAIFWLLVGIAAFAYCIALYQLGYQTWLEFQVIESQSQELSLPASAERWLARATASVIPAYTGPVASLVRKELRLHRVSFMVAGFSAILAPILAVAWKIHPSDVAEGMMGVPLFLCFFCIPLLAGLVTVAEERNMGVLAWQLTQPISPGKQWFVKMLVAFFVCVLLGVFFPGILLAGGKILLFGAPEPGEFTNDLLHTPEGVLVFQVLFYLVTVDLVIFGSSISPNVARAMAAAVGMILACGTAIFFGTRAGAYLAVHWFGWYNPRQIFLGINSLDTYAEIFVFGIQTCLLMAALVWINRMAFANFRSPEVPTSRIWRQIFSLLSYVFIAMFGVVLLGWYVHSINMLGHFR